MDFFFKNVCFAARPWEPPILYKNFLQTCNIFDFCILY